MSTISWNQAIDKFCTCVEGLGFEFVGAEIVGSGRNGVLRIYADTPTGITIGQITDITHQVLGLIEVDLPTYKEYGIEVSSPGLERPLFKLADYQRFVGSKVRIHLHTPLDGRSHFTGKLISADADQVTLNMDEKEAILPFSEIEKAKLVPEISFKKK